MSLAFWFAFLIRSSGDTFVALFFGFMESVNPQDHCAEPTIRQTEITADELIKLL
jgi:hypothetical protein